MDNNTDIRQILKEISDTLSQSLSTPEIMDKLETIQNNGYHLYLVLEGNSPETASTNEMKPIMPISLQDELIHGFDDEEDEGATLALTEGDKIFLRTLKIQSD